MKITRFTRHLRKFATKTFNKSFLLSLRPHKFSQKAAERFSLLFVRFADKSFLIFFVEKISRIVQEMA